ncbi:MAG: hypothetical protein DMG16_18645 [Acidobacteria bacterium]|nr:MAG: hypothetical protein DMG16_18645 [Acidobacteriota bacterium]
MELCDIVLTMHGLDSFEQELKNCVEVSLGRQKLKVLRLDRILASNQAEPSKGPIGNSGLGRRPCCQ